MPLLLLLFFLLSPSFPKLLQLHVVSRHCDRLPVTTLKLDPKFGPPEQLDPMIFLDSTLGTLTSLGVAQCYMMGEALRSRYFDRASPNVLDEFKDQIAIFNDVQFGFFSTRIRRAIRSLEAASQALFTEAAGLPGVDISFAPLGLSPGDPPLPTHVQPISIRHNDTNNDPAMLGYQKHKCGTIQKRWDDSTERQILTVEYASVIDELKVLVREDQRDQITFDNAYGIFDLLHVLKSHGRLPVELDQMYVKAKNLSDASFSIVFGRDVVGKLGAGELVRSVLDEMKLMVYHKGHVIVKKPNQNKDSNPSSSSSSSSLETVEVEDGLVHPSVREFRRVTGAESSISLNSVKEPYVYVHYGCHDSTIGALLAALRLSEDYPDLRNGPPYGSAVLFELHEDDVTGVMFVRILFLNGWNGDFQEYGLTTLGTLNGAVGCQAHRNCQFETFQEAVLLDAIPHNWCAECGLSGSVVSACISQELQFLEEQMDSDQTLITTLSLLLGASSVLSVILTCGICLLCLCKKGGWGSKLVKKSKTISSRCIRFINGQGLRVSVADEEELLQSLGGRSDSLGGATIDVEGARLDDEDEPVIDVEIEEDGTMDA